MERKIHVRSYKKRSGSKVKGHDKKNPQFTIKAKSKIKDKAIQRLAERVAKYAFPPLKLAKDATDTVEDIGNII